MYNVDRVQNNLQRQYWTMDLSPQQVKFGHGGKNSRETHSNNRVVYFSPFSAGQMTMDVSPGAAAVTLINILNCHSCLVWSMDNSAEPWSGPVWMGPHEPGWGWEEVGRDQASRVRETLLAQSSVRSHHGQLVRSKIIMTWQIINKHSRVISKAKLMNSFQVFYSRPKNIFYCILICIELATDRRQTNNNTKWIRFINILFKTVIFSPVLLLGRIRPAF